MKRLALGLLLLAAVPAEARFAIGPSFGYFDYEEPGLMKDYGFLFGAQARYDTYPILGFRFGLKTDFAFGKTTYEGALFNVNTGETVPYTTSDQNWILQSTLFVRRILRFGDIGIGAEAGIRYYQLENSQEGAGAYDRSILQGYFPVTAELQWRVLPSHDLGFRFTYLWFMGGRVTSLLSMTGTGFPDVTNRQDYGKGSEAEVYLAPLDEESFRFGVRYLEHRIGDSNTLPITSSTGATGAVTEPANRTRLTTAYFVYQF